MRNKHILLLILAVVLLLSSCTFILNGADSPVYDDLGNIQIEPSDSSVQFHFIDVGQGDCIFIQNGEKTVLIDAGTSDSGHKIYEYLHNLGIKKLDYFILTHPHDDHIGGAVNVIKGFDIGKVLLCQEISQSYSFENMINSLAERNITPELPDMGARYIIGGMSLRFLSPFKDFNSTNDTSYVILVEFDSIRALFTGDAERAVEADILSRGIDIRADILKVAHHGSRNASSSQFLNAVMPSVAVIQCGKDNSYGHPHEEAVSRLNNIGCKILRTDEEGSIVLTTDGKTVSRSDGSQFEKAETTTPITVNYIGNKKSKVLHADTCPNLPSENNQVIFDSRESAINQGYKACGNCNP